jgi:hypothetical protein
MSAEKGDVRTDQLGLVPALEMGQDVLSGHTPLEHDRFREPEISTAFGEPLGNGAVQRPGQPVLASLVADARHAAKDPKVPARRNWITLEQQTIPIRVNQEELLDPFGAP